jgi:hypothetical protein
MSLENVVGDIEQIDAEELRAPFQFLATETQIYIISKPRGPMNPKTKPHPIIDIEIPMPETAT